MPPIPGLRGREPHLGAQQASWARVGGANALLSCSSGLGGPLPPASPDLPGLPPMPPGPTRPGGDFGGQGTGLGTQQAPRPSGSGDGPFPLLSCSSRESLPPASPDLPGLRGTDPVWPPPLLPLLSPHILPVHLGVPPVSLGVRVPHQWLAGTLVVGRRLLCFLPHCLLDSTLSEFLTMEVVRVSQMVFLNLLRLSHGFYHLFY